MMFAAVIGGCGTPPPEVPPPPAMLERPADYGFGDTIAAADAAAVAHVVDLLRPDHGRPEITRYTAPAGESLKTLRRHYETGALAAGWHPIKEVQGALTPGENALAYRATDKAFAVVWLTPRPGAATPVNVIRFER